MPLFEYRCPACRKRTTVLVRTVGVSDAPVCEHCGGGSLTRLVSRFALHRSSGGALDWDSGEDGLAGADTQDPQAMAGWMRRMHRDMGEESTPEFEQMVEELESGSAFDNDEAVDADDF